MSTGAGKRGMVGEARGPVRRKAATKIQRAVRKRQSHKKKVDAAKKIQKVVRGRQGRNKAKAEREKAKKPSGNTRSKGKNKGTKANGLLLGGSVANIRPACTMDVGRGPKGGTCGRSGPKCQFNC